MNKFELMHVVLQSTLKPADKPLLVELILLSDEDWTSWPSVERLCQVRGITHEKNFKGVEHYLPGLVGVYKRGRKNTYRLNIPAIEGLPQARVTIKHTVSPYDIPAAEGSFAPANAADYPAIREDAPAVEEEGPAVEGAISTINNTKDTSQDNTCDTTERGTAAPGQSEEDSFANIDFDSFVEDSSGLNSVEDSFPVAGAPGPETSLSGSSGSSSSSSDRNTVPVAGAPVPAPARSRTREGILRGILVNPQPSGSNSMSCGGGPPTAGDPAAPTELEIRDMMTWLRQYSPIYRDMKSQDLRVSAENRLRLPLRRAEDRKRLEVQERLRQAAQESRAAREKELTW